MNFSQAVLCEDADAIPTDTGCRYPYVNKGFIDPEKYVPGDCSMTYADVHGSGYDVKCAVYSLLFLPPAIACITYLQKVRKSKKKPKAGKPAKLNVMELTYICIMILCFCNVFKSIDIDYTADRINMTLLSFVQGVGLAAVLNLLCIMSTSWISMIVGGKRAETPIWLRNYKRFSQVYFTLAEGGVSAAEYHVGEAANIHGAYDGTLNGTKNVTVGILLMTWAGLSIYYGSHIQKMLSAGGTSASEAKKIGNFCKAIGIISLLGFAYKSLSIFRFGKTMFEPIPCDFSFVNILGVLFMFISYYITIITRPTPKKMAKMNESAATTTTSSVAPEP
eukprot:CAMPEP_0182468910 /NCGR_PEP_ID=MMETSP1319-20130603/16233_1 /TAXON_ID=172717 /ORGANISM="Bolidomonas pacifica, Strain RCC208" /LENGTH=333 /DNA_ID=CAMNT_0024669159 /DNA_START=33 /DNA_END=1034 /DNA_ORIENTATION=+